MARTPPGACCGGRLGCRATGMSAGSHVEWSRGVSAFGRNSVPAMRFNDSDWASATPPKCTVTRRSESVTEFSGMQRMGTMSLPSTLLLALSVCVLALQIAPCHSIFSAPFSVRHSSVAPSVGAEVRHRPMRLRGGIEYYENRMDVQDAIQALKQVRKETC